MVFAQHSNAALSKMHKLQRHLLGEGQAVYARWQLAQMPVRHPRRIASTPFIQPLMHQR